MIVKIALPLVLAFIMFSLGLGLKGGDFARVVKFPKAFGMGLFNQLILLPLVAYHSYCDRYPMDRSNGFSLA